ncbi:MAG: ceramidase domain-containing protein [Bacteroidales bacterium]
MLMMIGTEIPGEMAGKMPDLFNGRLPDGGPVYAESVHHGLIAEPWNAVSSLFIVLPALVWLVRIRHEKNTFRLLFFASVLVILGGTGSTLFHAFRAYRLLLFMDFIPPAVLTLVLAAYWWQKVWDNWWAALLAVAVFIVPRFLFFGSLPEHTAINLSYTLSGIMTGLPWLILLIRNRWQNIRLVLITLVMFLLAILCREMDVRAAGWLPMGTHFLWHLFSGAGVWFLLEYLYRFRREEIAAERV